MSNTAQVIVNIPTRSINKPFSYLIPDEFNYVEVGWRVLVTFGNRKVEGFVVGLSDDDTDGLKPILDLLDDYPWFDLDMLSTARWLSEYYLCSLAEAMRLFIPGLAGIKTEKLYQAVPEQVHDNVAALLAAKPEDFSRVFDYISSGRNVTLGELHKRFNSVENILKYLVHNKLIEQVSNVKKRGRQSFKTVIKLAVEKDVALAQTESYKGKPAQWRLINELVQVGEIETSDLRRLKITQDTVKRLLTTGLILTEHVPVVRDSYQGSKAVYKELQLTSEQDSTLSAIIPTIIAGDYKSYLIHGITGSGKTHVYINAVAEARKIGRQAIVLVPEIALTSQIVARFKAAFADDVVVMHSKLSVGERHDAWRRLRSGDAGIAIGARSAVFAPVANLGVMIIDEEHEFTYKQEESPRYHARQVAEIRARHSGAALIFGSATPSVETYYNALCGTHTLLTMNSRVDNAALPPVTVVDMREELSQGRRSVISAALQEVLTDTLRRKEQAVVLLNRRGYSTFILCRECGYVLKCRHCDISLVYHANGGSLRCHYCQEHQAVPDICPECGSRYIKYFGTGTQKVEEALAKLFPEAKIVRMDQDTTGGKMAHDKILSAFSNGTYDILLGTQMVAKGHDIPNVTSVGIISADTALNLPDFRAAEKTFALLTQAAGRAGRGCKPGKVVMQTYNPEHYAIKAGAAHDYLAFYHQEIEYRRQLRYPPFVKIIKLTVQAENEVGVHRRAGDLAAELNQILKLTGLTGSAIIGPFPAAINKIKDIYRVNMLIKTEEVEKVCRQITDMGLSSRKDIIIDVDPVNVL